MHGTCIKIKKSPLTYLPVLHVRSPELDFNWKQNDLFPIIEIYRGGF